MSVYVCVWGGGAHVAGLNLSCCNTYIRTYIIIIILLIHIFSLLHFTMAVSLVSTTHVCTYFSVRTYVQRVPLQYWYYWCRSVQVHATLYICLLMDECAWAIAIPSCSARVYVCVCTYVRMCVQILMSVLFLVLRWVTLRDLQCGIVQMRVFPWDGHLAVIVPDSRVNQSIATDCRSFWPRAQACANCKQNCMHARTYVCT